MIEDCLKLTTYFGELDRTAGGFLSDYLMDLYGRHRLETSILLRGAEGFGRPKHVHTDRLLSRSEDLPFVSFAVDERRRIEALLDPLLEIKHRGLITLERARLLSGEIDPIRLPVEQLHEATKLTIYLRRQERVYGLPAFVAVCDLLHRREVAGATVLLGVDGTRRGSRSRAKFFGRNADVPMMVLVVASAERIARVLPELGGLLRHPLMTLERVQVCKVDGELISEPPELSGTDEHGMAIWQKLMIYTSHCGMYRGEPLHLALIRGLRKAGAAGATCLRGTWGFHGDHAPHGDRILQIRRHVPVCTIVIDTPERIAKSFEVIDEITREQGLVTSEMVPALAALHQTHRHGDLRLADHDF